jgi:hypothetical protein
MLTLGVTLLDFLPKPIKNELVHVELIKLPFVVFILFIEDILVSLH